LPQADAYQDIRGLHIDSPVSYVQGRDLEYGNAFAAFAPTAQQTAVNELFTQRIADVSTRFAEFMDKSLPAFAAELRKATLKDLISRP